MINYVLTIQYTHSLHTHTHTYIYICTCVYTHSCRLISCTEGLFSGSLLSMCCNSRCSSGPTAGGGGAGSPRPIASNNRYTLSPSNGYFPVVILYLLNIIFVLYLGTGPHSKLNSEMMDIVINDW